MIKKERDAVLDDFRAIAILLVVLMHSYGSFWAGVKDLTNPLEVFIASGGAGVNLFFVLSGFLVSLPFLDSSRKKADFDYWRYASHRALRILPPYYFMVLLGCLITAEYHRLPEAVVFLARGTDVGFFSTVWWSLAVEVQFYILLPLLFFIFMRFGRFWILLIFAVWVIWYLAWCLGYINLYNAPFWFTDSIVAKFPPFLFGFFCACRLSVTKRPLVRWEKWVCVPYFVFLLLTLWHVLTMRAKGTDSFFYELDNPEMLVLEALLWSEMIFMCMKLRVVMFGVLGAWIAKISYSLYLVHMPIVIYVLMKVGIDEDSAASQRFVGLLVALAFCFLVAWLFYWFIERPFFVLRERLLDARALKQA